MVRYALQRLGQSIILLVLVSMIGFAVLHLAPGGPLAQFAMSPGMSVAQMQRIAHQMGLDQPLPIQYGVWAGHILVGDWGRSYRDNQPVLTIIASHLGATLELMITATLIAIFLGTWVGVLGAIRRYSLADYLATIGAMIALSIPTFWFGLVVIYIFAVRLAWLPAGNIATAGTDALPDRAIHLILPSDRAGAGHHRHLEPLHARLDAGGDQPGLRAHGARQGAVATAACWSTTPCATRCCR